MSMTAALPTRLLAQARHLAHKEPRKPQQASLRRAASAAYYALFHLLVSESSRAIVGAAPAGDRFRSLVGRAFRHEEMGKASKAFGRGAEGLPAGLLRLPDATPIPADLAWVAETFAELREVREEADYDTAASFEREHVLDLLARTEKAFAAWVRVRGQPAARLYLVSLLLWNRVPKE